MAKENSFRELFQLAIDGDRDAQANLYLEQGPYMRDWIRIKLRRLKIAWAVDPDDVFDSFFARIIEGRIKTVFKTPLHFVNYCEKSLLNKCQQTLRSVILRMASDVAECPTELFEDAHATEQLEGFAWNEQLENAYSQLTHLERVVCFFRLGGHNWEEIGERLGKSGSAVRKVHQRAAQRMGNGILAGGGGGVISRTT